MDELENFIYLDGLDDALIGIGERIGMPPTTIYDEKKCIEIFMKRDQMTYEEAVEYFEFNVICAYFGVQSPIFVRS